MRYYFGLVSLMLCLLSPQSHADESLYQAMNARLALMKDVAAYKWINKLPVTAIDREAVVINRAAMDGLRHGLTTSGSASFFRAQIEAAKDIQQCWHQRWDTSGGPTQARDLNGDVRPELIRLGTLIVSRLPNAEKDPSAFNQSINIECLSRQSKDSLFMALLGIKTYPNRLAQIQESGILRIGTTGDYAPFSWAAPGSQPDGDANTQIHPQTLTGIDIDLAKRLARSLSAEVHFIKTSWPTLMADLAAGHYDIAMSGVSITAARLTTANFSAPYHRGGKTPVSRCHDKSRYTSLEAINQSNVRVIVNPGGTNEKFLDGNLTEATKILHNDNRTIFNEILSDRADVMVTDAIEAKLMSAELPGLCETMPGRTLTVQDKGYMMPQDARLTAAVNQWLTTAKASGELKKVFSLHLP